METQSHEIKFTPEEIAKCEAIMRLRDLKVGHTLTEMDMAGIEYFLGTHIMLAKSLPLTKLTFEPNDKGEFVQTGEEKVPYEEA